MGEGVLSVAPAADPALLFEDAGLTRSPDGILQMAGVPLDRLAREVGTPAYVYNAEAIRRRYAAMEQAFAFGPHRLCYAVKANSNLAILRLLRDLGAGADIVSAGELRRALAAGFPPETIVFSGVGKTADEIDAAVTAQVGSINIESVEELETLVEVVERHPAAKVRVGIRANPDVTVDTHPYITTGKRGHKFGVPLDQVVELARRINAHSQLALVTLAMHLGSQLLAAEPWVEGLRRLLGLWDELTAAGIDTLEHLDIGGGLGIRYRNEEVVTPDRLAEAVKRELGDRRMTLHLEPGRFLVGSAGILLTRVIYRKRSGGKTFIIADAGMNDLVRPSHYRAYHEIVEVEAHGRPVEEVDVVGPVCETGDFLALERRLPELEPGELLAVLGAGAYGFVMASTYNARPCPVEVLVDGGRAAIVRPRASLDDLFRGESLTPFAK
jgi:diaminopimelate decarboxylase